MDQFTLFSIPEKHEQTERPSSYGKPRLNHPKQGHPRLTAMGDEENWKIPENGRFECIDFRNIGLSRVHFH